MKPTGRELLFIIASFYVFSVIGWELNDDSPSVIGGVVGLLLGGLTVMLRRRLRKS